MKSSKYLIIFSFIVVSTMLPKLVFGQEVWSLQKCVETALKNNLSIKSSELSLENNAVDVKQSIHARYPNLDASTNIYWNFGRTIDPTSNTFTTETFLRNGLSLNTGVVLFNGFVLKNSIQQAKTNTSAIKEDLLQMKNDISLNVATFYLNALFAKENLAIANANLGLTKNTLNQVLTFVKSGTRAQNETLDIEAQLANDEQNVIIANNNFINAITQLKQIMLVNEDFDVNVDINSAKLSTDPETMTLDEVYTKALANQHGIKAEEFKTKASEIGIKIAQGQRYPTVTFGGNLGSNYSNQGIRFLGVKNREDTQTIFIGPTKIPTDITTVREVPVTEKADYLYQFDTNLSYGLGFGVSMPILNNYRTSAGIERAKISNKVAHLSLETKKQQLKVDVQQALNEARAAKVKLAAAEKSILANQAAFDNANKRFQIGSITSFDLTNARTRLDNAKNNLLIAKYDHVFKIKVLEFYLGKGISL